MEDFSKVAEGFPLKTSPLPVSAPLFCILANGRNYALKLEDTDEKTKNHFLSSSNC